MQRTLKTDAEANNTNNKKKIDNALSTASLENRLRLFIVVRLTHTPVPLPMAIVCDFCLFALAIAIPYFS